MDAVAKWYVGAVSASASLMKNRAVMRIERSKQAIREGRSASDYEMPEESDDRRWQEHAECLGVDPDLFFPERGASITQAKAICDMCVVKVDCGEYALRNGEKFGVWGGMSERERRRIQRQRALARRPLVNS